MLCGGLEAAVHAGLIPKSRLGSLTRHPLLQPSQQLHVRADDRLKSSPWCCCCDLQGGYTAGSNTRSDQRQSRIHGSLRCIRPRHLFWFAVYMCMYMCRVSACKRANIRASKKHHYQLKLTNSTTRKHHALEE
ncbi:hypothetical protein BDW02DRAFT_310085 [Decorospora gaudefroyi]|uniref:Uncharacterized protein n=1 Tax=Decorospora gaudefroyi TaxID=184978 RepID=A0A6A5KHH0_9PLEO|nr:hypothetical protein BDW02DRAFT_310085 [Decorospora gaudefroyi]